VKKVFLRSKKEHNLVSLRIFDKKIIETGKIKGIDTTYKTALVNNNLNGCVIFVNGSAPQKMLQYELRNGDNIDFVYGFCGG
jgi:hypothetical protein